MPFAALLLAATTAVPAVPLTPAGPWIVNVDENMCLLERNYPVADQRITLIFQPLLDLDGMEMYVATADRSDRQYQGLFKASVEPGAQTYTGRYYSVRSPKLNRRMTRIMTERVALDQLKDGDILHVQAKPVDLSFKIARPDKARVALQKCVDDLKKSWGIDPEMASRIVEPLDGNPARYFSTESYPPEAYHAGIYGRVVALLNINPQGTVDHCRIVSSAGSLLNDGTCKVALRIRFKPPRDRDGHALSSTYFLPVRWVLPGAPG